MSNITPHPFLKHALTFTFDNGNALSVIAWNDLDGLAEVALINERYSDEQVHETAKAIASMIGLPKPVDGVFHALTADEIAELMRTVAL